MSAFTLVKVPEVTKMDVPRESFFGDLGNEDKNSFSSPIEADKLSRFWMVRVLMPMNWF